MQPFKALRIDGLHAFFYRSQWHIVGASVCNLVKNVFNDTGVPHPINKTLIVLIPKNDQPSSLRMYKPISLCSMIYKTITKIASNRLKTILPNLIGLTQISFVLGQNITENIIIAQEIIHNMLQKKGKRGQILIKVDLEKAYDCLSWSFIRETLCEVRLPAG